jgi:hypothetical protein
MLDDPRRARLTEYLSTHQYALTRHGNNTLAIKRAADPTNEHAAARSAAEQ